MRAVTAVVAFVGIMFLAAPLNAQAVERPVAFDSLGRVMTITLALATRLGLSAPAWPVSGDFMDARIFDRGDGSFVVVVQRAGGVVERYVISGDARVALQQVITSAMQNTGSLSTGERQDVVSEPAKGKFVRDQTLGAAFFYGPALASLTGSGSGATAVYFATVGATFFVTAQFAKGRSISKAQNQLATSGTWRGGAIANGLLYVLAGDDVSSDLNTVASLGGAIAGSIIGFRAGLPLTDGEAHGATFGSTFSALTTAGLIGSVGGFRGEQARGEMAVLIGAVVAGYPLGLRYVRRASYAITPGDITSMSAAAQIGVFSAATFIVDSEASSQAVMATLTAGLIAGTLVGDRIFARRYDFTESQGRLMGLGALAGALVGIGAPLAAEADDGKVYFAAGSIGAIAGMALSRRIIDPAIGSRHVAPRGAGTGGRELSATRTTRGVRAPVLRLHPENAGMLFAKPRARVSVPFVSVRF